MSSVVQFMGVAVDDIKIGAAVEMHVDVQTGRSTVRVARAFPPATPVLTEADGTEWYVEATEQMAALPHVLVASSRQIDRDLEAYYRQTFERICGQMDAIAGDMLKAARADERARIVAWLSSEERHTEDRAADLAEDIEGLVWK